MSKTESPVEIYRNALKNTESSVGHLVQSIDEIDGLVRVIRDIAGKTDLLALNASIEAARAGQAGKGFSIVADEVGRLSEKVQQLINAVEISCSSLRKHATQIAEEITAHTENVE